MRSRQPTRRSLPPEARPDEIPIGSLSDELLCEIFRLVQSSDWLSQAWCRVLWVCRRWSAVGRAAAFLWCDITIRGVPNRAFILASLEYSKNALLEISFLRAAYLAEILPLLSPHIYRIRSLSIDGDLGTTNGSALAIVLSYAFPSLETFQASSQPTEDPLIWQPDASGYPLLRNLILEGPVSIKVAPTAVFPALRKLILSYDSNPSFTFQSFMQFLFRHLHLEKLELYEYNLALDCPFATATFPPALRSFSLRGYDRKYIKDFLSSFTDIPAHVSLSISGEYDGYHTENTPGSTTHMLPDPPQRHLHTLSRVTSVEITGDLGSTWSLVGRALSGDEDPLVEFEVRCLRGRHSFLPPLQLADAVRIFCGAPVVEVRLTNNIIGKIHKAEWVALFDAFPLLEHVAIEDVKIRDEDDAREGL